MQLTIKRSIIDPETIKLILADYDLTGSLHCEYLAKGLNDTYFVLDENRAKYIFRLYRTGRHDYSAISFELEALQHLKNHDMNVSWPVPSRKGQLIHALEAPEGRRYGVLFSYSEGERPKIDAASSALIGETLGRLHRLSADFQSTNTRGFDLNTDHLLDEPAAAILPVIETYLGDKAAKIFDTAVKNTVRDLAALDIKEGFCHGDFYNHNFHVNEGAMEVFDFDDCAVGFQGYDIAVAWWNIKNNCRYEEQACWEAFLQGYLAEESLSGADIKSLPLFISARRVRLLADMVVHDDVWGTNWINQRSLELFVGQLRTDRLGDEDLLGLDYFDNDGEVSFFS